MTVAVDLDNVVADTDPKIRQIIHRLSGISLSQEDIKVFAYSDALIAAGLDNGSAQQIEEEALWLFHQSECSEIPLVTGAADGLARLLSADIPLIIATSRPPSCEDRTRSWLKQFGLPYEDLLFIADKAQMARAWKLIVDDGPHHAKALSAAGVPVVLLDYPWNRSVSDRLIHRASGWGEITDIVFSLVGGVEGGPWDQ